MQHPAASGAAAAPAQTERHRPSAACRCWACGRPALLHWQQWMHHAHSRCQSARVPRCWPGVLRVRTRCQDAAAPLRCCWPAAAEMTRCSHRPAQQQLLQRRSLAALRCCWRCCCSRAVAAGAVGAACHMPQGWLRLGAQAPAPAGCRRGRTAGVAAAAACCRHRRCRNLGWTCCDGTLHVHRHAGCPCSSATAAAGRCPCVASSCPRVRTTASSRWRR